MTKKDRLKANDEGDSWIEVLDRTEVLLTLSPMEKEWLRVFIKERIRRAVAVALLKAGVSKK